MTNTATGAGDYANPPLELLRFLARHDPATRSLAIGLRLVVLDAIAPCHEYIFQMRPKVVLLYGATSRVMADGICQIAVFRHHVTLVFPEGVDLEDPAKILRGSGTTMRHVRVTQPNDLARSELRPLLRQARTLAAVAAKAEPSRRGVVTRVKPQPR
jgi:hypothetical protein